MSGDGLPTAREAMKQAVEWALVGDIERGTLWLGIARELRLGEAPPARPMPRPLDGGNEGPPEVVVPPIVKHVEHEDERRAAYADAPWVDPRQLAVPAERPAYRDAQTEVIRTDRPEDEGLPRCGQDRCELRVELALDQMPAIWVHALTQQPRCPASLDGEPTYAAPMVDARG